MDKEHEEIRLNGIAEDSLEEWLRHKVVERRIAEEAANRMVFVSNDKERQIEETSHRNVLLNLLQVLIMILAVTAEVLAVQSIIPQGVAIIILAVLTVSCFAIIKIIDRRMAG
ncbi:hypothetical protein acsn021_28840 [Anaerocolumna cellulosilytica]|uniref:Uncharacterized protein n=1 Tax=Anaerocolumna cellulosilytica TaxID=433286 RepID=A0A6S6R7U2_9FIRM|nr:hypothetical protein [Anaerocolumna cellulosilytica]MBB5197102.1 putative membrane protein [Anaerocolumna cellulosilytica]BCJ95315.1 hypothetical protein acsn021_28840 [Anaerocolumna cellulosilytica]